MTCKQCKKSRNNEENNITCMSASNHGDMDVNIKKMEMIKKSKLKYMSGSNHDDI